VCGSSCLRRKGAHAGKVGCMKQRDLQMHEGSSPGLIITLHDADALNLSVLLQAPPSRAVQRQSVT
jgi:predicted nuclease of predicted toxin-antitoxin system